MTPPQPHKACSAQHYTMVTLNKAISAAVIGSDHCSAQILIDYCINLCRSVLY